MSDEAYVMLGHGRAYSNKHEVNVIFPHYSNHEGNHFFRPARRQVAEYIRRCIEDLIDEVRERNETLWPAYPHPRVVVRAEPGNIGQYKWTVWDE
jgi:hypothetical protein